MRMLPVIVGSAATGIAAMGFAAAVDRLDPAPRTAPAPNAFATERVDPALAVPVRSHAPVAPRMTLLPPAPTVAVAAIGDRAPAARPANLLRDEVIAPAAATRHFGGQADPLDDLSVARRNDLRHVPMIGVYR